MNIPNLQNDSSTLYQRNSFKSVGSGFKLSSKVFDMVEAAGTWSFTF